jgi:hypothetical protein
MKKKTKKRRKKQEKKAPMENAQSSATPQRHRTPRGFLRGMPHLGFGGSSLTIRRTLTYADSTQRDELKSLGKRNKRQR